MDSREVILRGSNIHKSFGEGLSRTEVLKGINITFYSRDFTVIMGDSGAGKSTLLYALSGMGKIDKGMIQYRGTNITDMSEKEKANLRAREFGFIFQEPQLVSNLTIFENVAISGWIADKTDNVERKVEELLMQLNLHTVMDRYPSQVSGGIAQRVSVARALIQAPVILFADEPTDALDRRRSETVLDLMTRLSDNEQNIIMVTHDLRSAMRGNRLLYLEDGKITGELEIVPYSTESQNEEALKLREKKISEWLQELRW
jgi:putative ABC transport system ATP-binding protein